VIHAAWQAGLKEGQNMANQGFNAPGKGAQGGGGGPRQVQPFIQKQQPQPFIQKQQFVQNKNADQGGQGQGGNASSAKKSGPITFECHCCGTVGHSWTTCYHLVKAKNDQNNPEHYKILDWLRINKGDKGIDKVHDNRNNQGQGGQGSGNRQQDNGGRDSQGGPRRQDRA
jgi:hypothetical protein